MASIKPQGNRILIKPKKATVSLGGILLPETAQQKPKEGIVVAVGPGELMDNGQRKPMSVCVGDDVVYASYGAHEMTQENEQYLILSENDVLGVLASASTCGCSSKSCK